MKKKILPVAAALILIAIVVIIGIVGKVVERYTPTTDTMSPVEYFGVSGSDELALILQNQLVEETGFAVNGVPYIEYAVVKEYLNTRFYWDAEEQLMIYTTPTEILQIHAESAGYTVAGKEETADHEIVKVRDSKAYLAADFVQKYTNMEYEILQNPGRLMITFQWGKTVYADVKKNDSIREKGGIKSLIIKEAAKGDKVTVLEQLDDWSKIMTPDGYIGFIENKRLGGVYEETTSREFEEPVYTSIKQEKPVNLVWHQITNQDSNYNLVYDIANMTGVNVISPTWFSISSNEGEISSLANENYVNEAHNKGLKVWGLVDNFSQDIDTATVLNSSTAREKLSSQLIAAAIQYKLDGINIDFESIPESAGDGFVQFMREISVKCRNNNLVLSADVPVPMPFTAFYDRKELGTVSDYVIVMGYDEHYVGSEEAGSVASLSFEETGIQETLKEVPAEKIISGIPFYTRLWKLAANGELTSEAIGMDTADKVLSDNGVTANWSEDTSQEYAEYEDAEGSVYKIWLENEKSIAEKVKLVKQYNLGGVAAWKLGFERSSIWKVIKKNMK